MLPFVAVAHLKFNDVLFTAIWAAINPVLLFLLLRRLRERGYSKRSVTDDLWLTVMFGVGSVYYFASVIGQVWYTAHVIAVTCVHRLRLGRPRRPPIRCWPACASGSASPRRTPLGFMFPFFVFEAVRATGGWERSAQAAQARACRPGSSPSWCASRFPSGAILALLLVHNYLRFEQFTEFGHKYLNIGWQDRIQRWGLFNYHFLSRNLTCALLLLPRILTQYPYVKVSEHGMSMLVTTPALGYTRGAQGDAARWRSGCGSPSWRPRCRRCSTRTRATCSSATASASTTSSSWSCCSRWAAAGSPGCSRP